MALAEETKRLVEVAERLKGPVGNEANTKALLIEPMLAALGWDTTDVEQMVRDWPVGEDSSIDYALRIDDANAVLVETRGVNQSLDDERFIAQTVNRVNHEGVSWCVLTNGLIYRVYKANEPVALDHKLLLEVDLANTALGLAAASDQSLSLLARASVADGSLQRLGDQAFTDPRVYVALTQLAANPSAAFLGAVAEAIGEPEVPASRLRASLARVFDGELGEADEANTARAAAVLETPAVPPDPGIAEMLASAAVSAPSKLVAPSEVIAPAEVSAPGEAIAPGVVSASVGASAPTEVVAPAAPGEVIVAADVSAPGEVSAPAEVVLPPAEPRTAVPVAVLDAEYPLIEHLGDKPAAIVDLFRQLDEYGRSLDATRRVRKHDVAYFRGEKSCFTLEVQGERILLCLSLDPAAVHAWWWSPAAQRYTIDLRERGTGEMEYSVGQAAELDNALQLIKLAYDLVSSPQAVR